MAKPPNTIHDYARTQRIVLLIDLNPLLHLPDARPYITTVISVARTLLSFPPFTTASTLFSFKLFFSSLSPLLSSSKLPISSLSLSFDRPNPTLTSLSHTLTSVLSTTGPTPSFSRAPHVAASLRQLAHDYAWDTDPDPNSVISSNLVVLFCPIVKSFTWFSEFFSNDNFYDKFSGVFGGVKEVFGRMDMHLCWVDVKCEMGLGEDFEIGFFEREIRDLNWGFCSSDCIVLGSAVVPFGLIYPKIGISQRFFNGFSGGCDRKIRGNLRLEILDVNGKPLECKFCDLELVSLNNFVEFANLGESMVWDEFSDGILKIHVKAVQSYDKCVEFEGLLSDWILVRECVGDGGKVEKGSCRESFENRVLEILEMEMGELVVRKTMPIWQILLSFLCRKSCYALVSISNVDGNSLTGVLKPFTVSSALLSIFGDKSHSFNVKSEFNGAGLRQFLAKTGNEICNQHSPSGKYNELVSGERKKKKGEVIKFQELTWSDFCKAALEYIKIDLEEVYIARGCSKSKKLKFLKCWMKQMMKSSYCSLTMPAASKPDQDTLKEVENRLTESPEQCAQPIGSCASVGENSMTGASRIQDEVALDFQSETLESFFSKLPHKIQQGVESEEVDLESLAARLVNSSIYWLYQKCEKEITLAVQANVLKPGDASVSVVAVELTKLLLKDPKDLAAMYRNSNPSSQASDSNSAMLSSENTVREYELQILFRMEILQSEVGLSIGEATKQRFVKQICLLLETIQCHLKGGFFGDWSLDKYVEKIIKSRYCQSLGDVVDRIYAKMDLLLFDDEDETLDPLLNSEDSNQSWRGKPERDEMDENFRINESISAEGEAHQGLENEHQSLLGINKEEHARKLIEAQERRQRARRFASFTSWVPDLQRVWAPKPKAMKLKSDPLWKLSKRKEPRKASYDMVCETPMIDNKRSCRGGSIGDNKDPQDYGINVCDSVSKALFQDD